MKNTYLIKTLTKTLEEWLNNIAYFRLAFFITLLITIFFDFYSTGIFILQDFYLILCIFLGFAYWKEKWIRFLLVGLVVGFRLYFNQSPIFSLRFINLLITYYLVSITSSYLIISYIRQKENTIQLTLALANAGVPESILTKPSRLTNEEFTIIKQHPVIGFNILKHIPKFNKNGILEMVLHHHERFDGKGYPSSLEGSKIPLAARIIAVADTFDAMTSKRLYRSEFDLEYTIDEIRNNAGTQFDPEVVNAFLNIWKREGTGICR